MMALAAPRLCVALLALAGAGLCLPAEPRAESNFITTDRPLPRNIEPAPNRSGFLSRLRVAMGLSAEPGEPMRLVPPAAPVPPEGDAVDAPSPLADDATFVPPGDDPQETAEAILHQPPPRPLVSVVAEPFGRETPEREPDAAEPSLSPSDTPLLAANNPAVSAVPRRHPTRTRVEPRKAETPDDPADAGPDGSLVSAVAVTASEPDTTDGDASAPPPVATTPDAPGIVPAEPVGVADGVRLATPQGSGMAFASSSAEPSGHGAPAADSEAEAGDAEGETARSPVYGPPVPSRLPHLMRMMSALQDDIALGASTALAAQRILSSRVAEELRDTPPETLATPANARALLHYALTGGSPPDVRAAVDRTTFAPPFDELLAGALAFLEGRRNDARRHFEKADLDHLPHVVVGPVHLALAALAVEKSTQEAVRHLDWARHSAPGTLVEEAALRRAVLIAAENNDYERFVGLTNRYLRKFRASAYAGNFRKRLGSALTRMGFLDRPDGFDKLADILEPMTADARREIYLDLARTAVENGRSAVAALAARRSRETAPIDSLDATRADLYAAAADVVDPERNDAAITALDTIDDTPLPDGDKALRTAALRLGQAVADLPPAADPAAPANLAGAELARGPVAYGPSFADIALTQEDEPSAIEERVTQTLAEIDAILRSSP